jgi:hypothetical protein
LESPSRHGFAALSEQMSAAGPQDLRLISARPSIH